MAALRQATTSKTLASLPILVLPHLTNAAGMAAPRSYLVLGGQGYPWWRNRPSWLGLGFWGAGFFDSVWLQMPHSCSHLQSHIRLAAGGTVGHADSGCGSHIAAMRVQPEAHSCSPPNQPFPSLRS